MSTAQRAATVRHRRRQRERGIVRLEVQVPEQDRVLVRQLARTLSGDPAQAQAVRARLRQTIERPPARSALEVFAMDEAADLPDDVLDDVLERDRDLPRDIDL